MLLKLTKGNIGFALLVLVLIYVIAAYTIPINLLIEILNGMFLGGFTVGVILYWSLVKDSLFANDKFNRVRQMTLGIAVGWLGRLLSCGYFVIYPHIANGVTLGNPYIVSIILYLGVIATMLQVSAPSYDAAFRDSFDKKLVYFATMVGAVIALLVFIYQRAV